MATAFKKEVVVRHAGFVYHKKHRSVGTDGKVAETWTPVMAYRGDTVTLEQESDYQNGAEHGAFWTSEYYPVGHDLEGAPKGLITQRVFNDSDGLVEETDLEPDFDTVTDAELADWVGAHTIDQVVSLAAGDPEKAAKLLEAEEAITGGDPRSGLVDKLDKIIGE